MKVVVTGTPGTGKTTATAHAAEQLDASVVHLNQLVKDEGLWTERDEARDTLVVDIDGVRDHLGDWDGILESHLAHHFDADRVVVLRCRPDVLEERLIERGESEAKARENRESEALDVILGEAIEFHGEELVYELDTTDRDPADVADELVAIVNGEREPSAGTVDFIEYL